MPYFPPSSGGGGAVSSVFGRTGAVTAQTGDYTYSQVGALPGVVVTVAAPTGLTATDTTSITSAIIALGTALASGPATLMFQQGNYQVDSNTVIIQSLSNFTVKSNGKTIISQAPNRVGNTNNVGGDLFVVADCNNFTVENLTFDALRDTISPITPLSQTAASGQATVTVAGGAAANYIVGQRLAVFGGLGTTDSNLSDGFADGTTGADLYIISISAGTGTGGGDVITFSANLTHSYTQIGGSAYSDAFGPFAWGGAYLTSYQTGYRGSVAGRTLNGEDQQNNLHLMNCSYFHIDNIRSRNCWESPVKCGTGAATQLTDGCSYGTISNCVNTHGYDQGVSLWFCSEITVHGCVCNSTGWAGISMTASDGCTITGNVLDACTYQIPSDNGSGCGIAIEGGRHNTVTGNRITNSQSDGFRLDISPVNFGAAGTNAPTLGAFIEGGVAAGTSILVSSTTHLQVSGRYSIYDGAFTEGITIATIVDATHITLTDNTIYGHASGLYISNRVGSENSIIGNVVSNPGGSGFNLKGHVRDIIKGNTIYSPAGNGIAGLYSAGGAGNLAYIGGDGSIFEGNNISGCATGNCITTDSVNGVKIIGNSCQGSANHAPILIKGLVHGVISENYVSDVYSSVGIDLQNGGLTGQVCTDVTVANNIVQKTSGEGIYILSGTQLSITGNQLWSCGGHAGISLHGVQYSVIANNICVSNKNAGIELEDNSSVYCLYNRITGNTCRDDGTGYNVQTGGSFVQPYGINSLGNSDYNTYAFNEMDSNGTSQLVIIGVHSVAYKNTISGVNISPAVTSPAIAASGTSVQNITNYDCAVYITGVLTGLSVGAVALGTSQTMAIVPAGQTITLSYASPPTWVWTVNG